MTDLLKDKLRAAEGASRELFEEVIAHIKPECWAYLDANHLVVSDARDRISRFMAAEAWDQSALSLIEEVLPGAAIRLHKGAKGSRVVISRYDGDHWTRDGFRSDHKSPAIALILALLDALAAKEVS